uniref:Homeobox protein Mohawk-like n=1 Tax=Petromyzon marinus TaxID=7757 RepID=A0AAJ7SYV0_PETMA|nr:homeobox protein Mohawk-like [Petromyzon marinus]
MEAARRVPMAPLMEPCGEGCCGGVGGVGERLLPLSHATAPPGAEPRLYPEPFPRYPALRPDVASWDVRSAHARDKQQQQQQPGRRAGALRVRHKRQALQDMARPLKHWLYKHRHNPYPTKTEKILLALGSHMTLVQVSNWFANARRRLKNTVRQPELSWAMRIKLYNQYVQGNAERLSISSGDSCPEDGEVLCTEDNEDEARRKDVEDSSLTVENVSRQGQDRAFPRKYKNSLLHRYLRDSCKHALAGRGAAATAVVAAAVQEGPGGVHHNHHHHHHAQHHHHHHAQQLHHHNQQREPRRSSHPASLSSACYEDGSLSPVSSESERRQQAPAAGAAKILEQNSLSGQKRGPSDPSSYWNELHAAMALTNLGTAGRAGPGAARAGPAVAP